MNLSPAIQNLLINSFAKFWKNKMCTFIKYVKLLYIYIKYKYSKKYHVWVPKDMTWLYDLTLWKNLTFGLSLDLKNIENVFGIKRRVENNPKSSNGFWIYAWHERKK